MRGKIVRESGGKRHREKGAENSWGKFLTQIKDGTQRARARSTVKGDRKDKGGTVAGPEKGEEVRGAIPNRIH